MKKEATTKTFTVQATMRTYLETTVTANSREEAEAVARDIDGSDFIEVASDWETHWDNLSEGESK